MNKFFKSIWSDALGAWVATSEKSPARGKRSGRVARGVAAVVLMFGAGSAMATFIPGTMNGINEFAMGNGSVASANTDPSGLNAALAIGSMTQALAINAVAIGQQVANYAANSMAMGSNTVNLDAASTNSVFFAPNGGSVTNSAKIGRAHV